ncbi:MAG TPA: GMC family oxidoreductase [Solirubrobacterales bacterium]|nr:GMC family oxidoreductase [Solirubrobacterales bacterium]
MSSVETPPPIGASKRPARPIGLGADELAVVAAFAETMAPAGGPLPPAELEVPVSASLGELSARLGSGQLGVVRAGIRAFDRLPFPRRFRTLTPAERASFLARLSRSVMPHSRELLLLMKTLYAANYLRDERVRSAIGAEARCATDGPEPSAPLDLGSLEPRGAGEECDFAIVGSGAGGASAALVLADAGFDVLVLEAGDHYDRRSYPDDPLEASLGLYRESALTIAEGLPPIPVPVGRVVGGTTVINSGTCFRAPDSVLCDWRDRFGIAWATELDEGFEEAERILEVQRPASDRVGRNGALVAEGAAALGLEGAPLARNAGSCVQCSSCPQGCRLDAKRAMHVSYLPRAVAAGARIRKGVDVQRVLCRQGRARELDCLADGRPWQVEARHGVILAGGTLGTPEVLLRSGLGGGAVGRNLRLHPSSWVGARFDEPVRGWEGIMQSYGIEQWSDRGVMLEATFTPPAFGGQWLPGVGAEHQRRLAEFSHIAANGVQVRDDHSRGRVRLRRGGGVRISYRLRSPEVRRLAFGIARAAEIFFAAGAREVYPQISGSPILRPADGGWLESRRVRAHDLRVEAFHPMGTARIGVDEGTTVADPAGAVRGTDGLWVADASTFPTAPGVNPMVTIIALARRIALGIAERHA